MSESDDEPNEGERRVRKPRGIQRRLREDRFVTKPGDIRLIARKGEPLPPREVDEDPATIEGRIS